MSKNWHFFVLFVCISILFNTKMANCQCICDQVFEAFKLEKKVSYSTLSSIKREENRLRFKQGSIFSRSKCLLLMVEADFKKDNAKYLTILDTIEQILDSNNPQYFELLGAVNASKGYIYDELGYLSLSKECYQKAVSFYDNETFLNERLNAQVALIKVMAELGLYIESIKLGDEISILVEGNDSVSPILKKALLNNIGFSYSHKAINHKLDIKFEEMHKCANKALDIFREASLIAIENDQSVPDVNIISTLFLDGQFDNALLSIDEYFKKCCGGETPLNMQNGYIISLRAMIQANKGNFDLAFRDAMFGFPIISPKISLDILDTPNATLFQEDNFIFLSSYVLVLLQNKAYVLKKYYESTKDVQYLEKSLDNYALAEQGLQVLHTNLFDDNVLMSSRMRNQSIYNNASQTSAMLFLSTDVTEAERRNKFWEQAYHYAEQNQSFSLRQGIIDFIKTECVLVDSNSIFEQESKLKYDLSVLKNSNNKERYAKKLEEYRTFVESLKSSQNSEKQDYYKQRFNLDIVSSSILQEYLLDETSIFIEYIWASPRPFALWATKQQKGLVFLNIDRSNAEQFLTTLEAFKVNWLREEGDLDPKIAHQLYVLLLEKVFADVPKETMVRINRLLITPDNFLRLIPFEALLTSEIQDKDGFFSAYLLNKYVVGYHHSATIWAMQTAQIRDRLNQGSKIGSFTNTSTQAKCSGTSFALHNLNELSSKKLVEISGGTTVFMGAKMEDVLKHSKNFDLLHFCVHGCIEVSPEKSYLAYPSNSADKLNLIKIYKYKNHARLAVFASCETARQAGEYESGYKGEGIIGLHRAFNFSGCPNTIATLNNVFDKPSSDLLTLFYQYLLRQEMPSDQALAEAKRSYLREGNTYRHPSFWANFICIGPATKFSRY